MRRCLIAIVLAIVTIDVPDLCCLAVATAAPFTPADDAVVLQHLAQSPLDPSARRLRTLQAELAQNPDNLALATRVAWMCIEHGRQLSDPRYYGYAQAALLPWWAATEPPVAVLVVRATVRQHDHDFGAALADLFQALRADPENVQAWLTQATVQQVVGHYGDARESCLQVLRLSSPLVAVTCLSSVESVSGSAAKSYGALRRALSKASGAEVGVRLWALTTLAEIAARTGQAAVAEQHFKQALSLGRPDDYLLAAYADFLLDHNQPEAVRDLLKDAIRSDALLLRLALAEEMLSSAELPRHLQTLRDRFAAARLRGDSVHRREEARFALRLLKQPDVALRLARENWQVQREPWDARLLLESALATGDYEAARPALEFRARTGTEDAVLARLAEQMGALRR